MNPIRIIVHTTADSFPGKQLDRINDWHKASDFPFSSRGYFVGYTYVVERDGEVIQTREDNERQAHVKGFNKDSIGIGVAGNHDYERPTAAQVLAVKNLILRLMTKWAINPNNVFGHRDFTKLKTCPGLRWPESEIKALFQPDNSYYQSLLNSLSELLKKLRTGKVGSASPCITEESKQ